MLGARARRAGGPPPIVTSSTTSSGSIAAHADAMDPLDVVDEVTIGGGPPALRARAPSIIAGPRDPEHFAPDGHRVVAAATIDEHECDAGVLAQFTSD